MATEDLSKSELERLSILVVEDNPHMRVLVRTILHGLGIKNVRDAGSGAEALEQLWSFQPSILIVDWMMSPMDGIKLSKTVRAIEDGPNRFVPILMMTGNTTRLHVELARDAGVDEFLAKPVSAKGLYERILAIVNNARLFVRSENFFGPDRRRQLKFVSADRRESEAELIERPADS